MPEKSASPDRKAINARQYQWDKQNTKLVKIKLNCRTDSDILTHLKSLPNVQGYIKSLIRADIEKNK